MSNEFLLKALSDALNEEMNNDSNVILLGEDVLNCGGGLYPFVGVPEAHPDKCFDMPMSEAGFTHFANGAALNGFRPVVDLMFSDFISVCFDPIVNGAAKVQYNYLGKRSCPTVYLFGNGGIGTYGGTGAGFAHSQCVEGWVQNVPGLKIVAPYYPADVKGLLKSSIRDNDPVIFLFHLGSMGLKGDIPDGEHIIALNNAGNVLREGSDVTIVAIQSMVPVALNAAEELAAQGISAEVIDPRVLIPLDTETIFNSVRKTGRLVVVHEAPTRGSFGNEIIAEVTSKCFDSLKAPTVKIGAKNTPISSGYAEEYIIPHKEDVVSAVNKIFKK